jgi:hypothetical protein
MKSIKQASHLAGATNWDVLMQWNKKFTGTDASCRSRRNNNNGQTNNDNPDPDQKCVFPFIWAGVKHNSCINDDDAGGSWCSTKVDRYGKYIDRKWGICSPTCPGK